MAAVEDADKDQSPDDEKVGDTADGKDEEKVFRVNGRGVPKPVVGRDGCVAEACGCDEEDRQRAAGALNEGVLPQRAKLDL